MRGSRLRGNDACDQCKPGAAMGQWAVVVGLGVALGRGQGCEAPRLRVSDGHVVSVETAGYAWRRSSMIGPDLTPTSWLLAAAPVALLILAIIGLNWSAPRAGAAAWVLAAAFGAADLRRRARSRSHRQRQGPQPCRFRPEHRVDGCLHVQHGAQAEGHRGDRAHDGDARPATGWCRRC